MQANDVAERQPLLAPEERISSTKIWPLIYHIKRDLDEVLDTALSWDQLTASDINFTTVRPLVLKYASICNMATGMFHICCPGDALLNGAQCLHSLSSEHTSYPAQTAILRILM
jgi:hypothetical protein